MLLFVFDGKLLVVLYKMYMVYILLMILIKCIVKFVYYLYLIKVNYLLSSYFLCYIIYCIMSYSKEN